MFLTISNLLKVVKYQRSYSVNTFTRCTGQHSLWQPLVKRPNQNVILSTFSRLMFLFCMRFTIFFELFKSMSIICRRFSWGLGPTTWNRLQLYPYNEVRFFVPRKMERWISTSNKNFKFILNQLGYFKGQLFSSLIIK